MPSSHKRCSSHDEKYGTAKNARSEKSQSAQANGGPASEQGRMAEHCRGQRRVIDGPIEVQACSKRNKTVEGCRLSSGGNASIQLLALKVCNRTVERSWT